MVDAGQEAFAPLLAETKEQGSPSMHCRTNHHIIPISDLF